MPHLKTILQSAIAVALATTLSGCVGISLNTQERPIGRAFDDFATRAELNGRLLRTSPELFANVSTTVIEGRVHLAGTVRNPDDRIRAGQLAWASPNVVEVVNNIEVTDGGGPGDIAQDRWISTQVRARILGDGSIRDINYSIDTQNQTVYVMGIAQDQSEIERVVGHAGSVRGVKRVVNYVVLKDDPRRNAPRTASVQPGYADGPPADDSRTQPDQSYVPEPVETEDLPPPQN